MAIRHGPTMSWAQYAQTDALVKLVGGQLLEAGHLQTSSYLAVLSMVVNRMATLPSFAKCLLKLRDADPAPCGQTWAEAVDSLVFLLERAKLAFGLSAAGMASNRMEAPPAQSLKHVDDTLGVLAALVEPAGDVLSAHIRHFFFRETPFAFFVLSIN